MRACVVIFPGTNADIELVRTLRDRVGIETALSWHKDSELPAGTDLCALAGGFSYGDYLRCGAIAKASPIISAIRRHAERGGYVIGICNGFQILTEATILPGALMQNKNLLFSCRDVYVKACADGPFTRGVQSPGVLRLPIAHAEGRYQASAAVLSGLNEQGRVAFRYCDRSGVVSEEANPNGSVEGIAGVYGGIRKNVLGLMPHPERMSEAGLGGSDGLALFSALVQASAEAAA